MTILEDRPKGDGRPGNRKDAWQGNGKLRVGSTTDAQSFQVNFEEAGYYTVQFDVQVPSTADPAQIILPRAEILWSVEGTFVRRLMNLSRGNAISGAGQGVKVTMFDFSILAGADPIEYFVSAQVTKGTRPNGAGSRPPIIESGSIAPTFAPDSRGAIGSFALAAGAISGNFIPVNAGINAVRIVAVPTNLASVLVYDSQSFKAYQCTLSPPSAATVVDAFNYDQFGTWQPVPPSARLIQIKNNTAEEAYVSVHWGVEG